MAIIYQMLRQEMSKLLLTFCVLLMSPALACTDAKSSSIPFLRLQIRGSLTNPMELAVRDDEMFRRIWNQMHSGQSPKPKPPEIDFAREMLIIVAFGVKPTGGHNIIVEDIQDRNDSIEVTVGKYSPGRNCIVTQVLTAPFDVVRLEKVTKPVVFRDRVVVHECK